MPSAFSGASWTNGDWKPAQPSAHLPRGSWWELFGDPELNRLETLAAEVRRIFETMGYEEVETPCLVPAPGMEPHLDHFLAPFRPQEGGQRPLWLHSSPEYAMKRLLAAGYRGQSFVWQQQPQWSQTGLPEWLRWLSFHQILENPQKVIVWVRSDGPTAPTHAGLEFMN